MAAKKKKPSRVSARAMKSSPKAMVSKPFAWKVDVEVPKKGKKAKKKSKRSSGR